MAEETPPLINEQGVEGRKHPQYVDYIRHNPYVKPWMLSYLPNNVYVRDIIVMFFGSVLGASSSVGLMLMLGDYGVVPGLVIVAATLWLFPGELQARYFSATLKFRREKKNACPQKPK